jgi:hypothetical protein
VRTTEVLRTVVTFESSAFNFTEPKEYFINPGCFGDDLLAWLAEPLREQGCVADRPPQQEDFGWYLNFSVAEVKHCLVVGYRPADSADPGVWVGWLERDRGFLGSLFGGRRRGITREAASAVHAALFSSPLVRNIRWHHQADFDAGCEDCATTAP